MESKRTLFINGENMGKLYGDLLKGKINGMWEDKNDKTAHLNDVTDPEAT